MRPASSSQPRSSRQQRCQTSRQLLTLHTGSSAWPLLQPQQLPLLLPLELSQTCQACHM
jgi:hypothetical protein